MQKIFILNCILSVIAIAANKNYDYYEDKYADPQTLWQAYKTSLSKVYQNEYEDTMRYILEEYQKVLI